MQPLSLAPAFLAVTLSASTASALTCKSPVVYAEDSKSTRWLHSNACTETGNLLSSLGRSTLTSVLSAYGIPGFVGSDGFGQHAERIVNEILTTRKVVVDEIDGLWDQILGDNAEVASANYESLLVRSRDKLSASITAKIANPDSIENLADDLQVLHDKLAAMIMRESAPSSSLPIRHKYYNLLHVYLHTADLLAAAKGENVHIRELSGRIQTCASDATMLGDVAKAQVHYCLDQLSQAARDELDAKVERDTKTQVGAVLTKAMAFAQRYSDTDDILRAVFEDSFRRPTGSTVGSTVNFWQSLGGGASAAAVGQAFTYSYRTKVFTVKCGPMLISSDGTRLGCITSFDGGNYGSVEEAVETHRRKVYYEMLMTQYVPVRRLLDHWWEQLRELGLASGTRPYLTLDGDVDALFLGTNAPGYEPAFEGYPTRDLRGTWRATWDRSMGASDVRFFENMINRSLSTSQRALLIGGALDYGPAYAGSLIWAMGMSDGLWEGLQPWATHLTLIRKHNREGRDVSLSADLTQLSRFYRSMFAAKRLNL